MLQVIQGCLNAWRDREVVFSKVILVYQPFNEYCIDRSLISFIYFNCIVTISFTRFHSYTNTEPTQVSARFLEILEEEHEPHISWAMKSYLYQSFNYWRSVEAYSDTNNIVFKRIWEINADDNANSQMKHVTCVGKLTTCMVPFMLRF